MHRRQAKWWIAGFFLALALLLPLRAVAAANPVGLEVYPLRSRPSQNPGDTSSGQITIANHTKGKLSVTMSVERFNVTNEDYDYRFSKGSNTDWVRLADNSVVLEPSASKNIAYSLAVPDNASPGGYYFAIFASSASGVSGTNFNEIKRVASLVYLQVNGNLNRKLNLLGVDVPWLVIHPALPVDSRLANQGNIHLEASLRMTTQPLFGRVSAPVVMQGLILPSTIRKIHSVLPLPKWPGLYHLRVQYSPPQGGTQVIQHTLIYLPLWAWFVLIVLLWVLLRAIYNWRTRKTYRAKP